MFKVRLSKGSYSWLSPLRCTLGKYIRFKLVTNFCFWLSSILVFDAYKSLTEKHVGHPTSHCADVLRCLTVTMKHPTIFISLSPPHMWYLHQTQSQSAFINFLKSPYVSTSDQCGLLSLAKTTTAKKLFVFVYASVSKKWQVFIDDDNIPFKRYLTCGVKKFLLLLLRWFIQLHSIIISI